MARTIAKDHDQKREQILTTAAKVFATEGFDRASMAMLARECGISKANIYHYYDSKDALLFDILETYLRELRDRICGIDIEGLTPEEKLRRAVAETLQAYQGADHEHQVQIGSMSALPEDQQKLLRGYQRDMVMFMRDIVASNASTVFEQDPEKLRATTMSVFGMLNWYYMWNSGAGTAAREEYADLVTNLTLGGVNGL
ncbi:TetR/AcrR family transcriptional regulator [Shimia thalassica]|uniref:Nicotinate degradation protein S n=1 Tax=Shimia thalassica TaxID=1715693 RepID=A0A0P1IBM2_9RHOB|nr:TetR/AcrR family transcriptional regulator [Shimia thalassica]PHO04595.1 TetR/AcrR family transcriptional regulator [Rhodobacteraceae bacterium 4F10]MBU2943427.1 TetR/AcrR family transcriptional regulator [Shimia thalassica]MDO6484507.1 TetR/AcrR family transcriptional regulator [Shimia thalassica]MDO6501497.1 TetR/AcrR family transcriptional regulator [Shimia thalassica]MDO6521860.1 TetR/AcrR family transcriptional regulator [Shimia thalassica]